MDKQQQIAKAKTRANALRDNLKKRKTFIKQSAQASLNKDAPNNAIGGGTEEDALKPED